MPRADSLFELIKSLTKSEKRYFKLFASMQGQDKKYVLLFDAVDAQGSYNEAELKRQFRGEKFVRQFSVAKNYLHSLIMKSLRLYHSGSTTRYTLHEMLLDIEILSDKRLKSQAGKLAAKAVGIAERYDRFPSQLEALVRKHGLEVRESMTAEGLERFAREQHEVLAKLSNLVDYGILFYQVARLVSRGNEVRTQEQMEELDQLMQHPLLLNEDQALSPRSRMRYHWIHAANHYARGEMKESLLHNQWNIALLENNPDLLPDHISLYIAAVSNALLTYERMGDREGFTHMIEKFRTRAQASVMKLKRRSREEAAIFASLYTHLFAMSAENAEFEKGIELLPDVDRGVKAFDTYLDEASRMVLQLHCSALCCASGEYRRALHYCNLVLLSPEPVEGNAPYCAAHLLNLVIHYELGNFTLLKGLLSSTKRFIRSRNYLHDFEQGVIDLLERLLRLKTESARINAFVALRDRLCELQRDPMERRPLQFFSYIDWLESHIQGRSLIEVARSRRDAC